MPQSLISYLEQFVSPERSQKILEKARARTAHLTAVFEDVCHPHNISAALRTCEALGIQHIHIIHNGLGARLAPNRGIDLGAHQWINIHNHDSTQAALEQLKAQGYRIVLTRPGQGVVTPESIDIAPKSAFFFGNEKSGLSREALVAAADADIQIPMVGFAESLNVSVSVGIILHTVCSRLRNSSLPWRLSEGEVQELRLQWLKNSIRRSAAILDQYKQEQGIPR